jgi:hypothetical protein
VARNTWRATYVGHIPDIDINAFLTNNYNELELWVLADNDGARRFYERQSAREVESRAYPIGEFSITEVRYVLAL